jgi:pyruvate/2-oxoglutarate dehydrogenase complex dihydrolipoamide acyltransferase (E2) component
MTTEVSNLISEFEKMRKNAAPARACHIQAAPPAHAGTEPIPADLLCLGTEHGKDILALVSQWTLFGGALPNMVAWAQARELHLSEDAIEASLLTVQIIRGFLHDRLRTFEQLHAADVVLHSTLQGAARVEKQLNLSTAREESSSLMDLFGAGGSSDGSGDESGSIIPDSQPKMPEKRTKQVASKVSSRQELGGSRQPGSSRSTDLLGKLLTEQENTLADVHRSAPAGRQKSAGKAQKSDHQPDKQPSPPADSKKGRPAHKTSRHDEANRSDRGRTRSPSRDRRRSSGREQWREPQSSRGKSDYRPRGGTGSDWRGRDSRRQWWADQSYYGDQSSFSRFRSAYGHDDHRRRSPSGDRNRRRHASPPDRAPSPKRSDSRRTPVDPPASAPSTAGPPLAEWMARIEGRIDSLAKDQAKP